MVHAFVFDIEEVFQFKLLVTPVCFGSEAVGNRLELRGSCK